MPLPDFQSLMLPLLGILSDGAERPPAVIREAAAAQFHLSEADLAILLPSGIQTMFTNRVAWALSYLKQAVLVESPRRGSYRITERGRSVLKNRPERINIEFLKQFPEFLAFRTASETAATVQPTQVAGTTLELTPDEQIRVGYSRLRESLAALLLERTKLATPRFFEQLVVDLLVRMGYGGSREDAGSVVGGSGDEGIDGIIKEDKLGLDTIYIQAKRWSKPVGRPDIQQFAGALIGQKARRGVFITTSSFTTDATNYAKGLQTTIVLIDGRQLAELMLDYGVGVSETSAVKLLKLDEDYFADE